MKGTTVTLEELLSPLKQYFLKDTFVRSDINNAPPLRAELFTLEQFGLHAAELAARHEVTEKKTSEHLLKRLAENEEVILRVIDLLQEAIQNKTPISPAGEWLLDNFYLIDEQIQIGKKHLPKGYSKGLPKIINGPSAGMPRVYDIAIEIISHSDGHLDIHILNRFIESYQKISELTLGELWAIPIMLRLALLENLRRVAARVAIDRIDANSAHHWADNIIETAENNPKNLVLTMADMARSNPPMVSAFIAEYSRKLQWKGINLALPLSWIEQHLSETGDTINSMVLAENQKQAADHVSMSNSIKSLRFLAKTNWREFVEAMSLVEKSMKEDAVYTQMDFYTRDQYRHVIEKISKRTRLSENEVAKSVINITREQSQKTPGEKHKSHVGYFLIGKGLKLTEKTLKTRRSVKEFFGDLFSNNAPTFYILGSILLTALIAGGLIFETYQQEPEPWLFYTMSVLSLLAASHLGIAIVNWISTIRTSPKPMPKMDFSRGIPPESKTLVIVPTMITGISQIEKLVEDLEVRFLGNRDPNLLFGLLTDFKDAQQEKLPEDDALESTVRERILELNDKYASGSGDVFFLFHRPRLWNPKEKKWMGYERKRGKLGDLNHVLRGSGKEKFSTIVGDESIYTSVKYVITLDTDTQLPRESAAKLVGVMSHPLNTPVYDERKKRVVDGYGIIQPRIAVSVHGAVLSRYTRLHENDSGIDPYTRVTSDVYQDVFGEGSFIGKGIYEIDTFEKVLGNRFPENRILSHDLLEGSYVRSGFASDVQFYEEYPPRYSMDVSRRHRWIRGDWQIGNWFLPWVPNAKGKYTSNPISALSRWKIFDNLRRSLVPVALFAMLVLGWTLSGFPFFWTIAVLGIMIIPSISMSGWHLTQKPKEISFSRHVENVFENTTKSLVQSLFLILCLPYEAFISADAILRTLWRMYISRRHRLEWNPSGFLQKQKENLITIFLKMFFAPLASGVLIYVLSEWYPASLFLAVPFLSAWILSPFIAYWISLPIRAYKTTVTSDQKIYLRALARKTWGFFEAHVKESENWLPPDNLQQYPIVVVAHRTSPTNIGLALLANLSAYDFGYITSEQLLMRTRNTFATMDKLERYAGHFFNWYDTLSLTTLQPHYISTVDSGNLAGHLITLRQGLLELPDRKLVTNNLWKGIYDTLIVLYQSTPPSKESTLLELQKEVDALNFSGNIPLRDVKAGLEKVYNSINRFVANASVDTNHDVMEWVNSLHTQIRGWQEEISLLAPLMEFEARPAKFRDLKFFNTAPTLNDLVRAEEDLQRQLSSITSMASGEETTWLSNFEKSVRKSAHIAKERISEIQKLAFQCNEFAAMEYDFLYDKSQHLVSIGYSVDDHRLDASFYDLLASEARLGIFVAIAQGRIPQESWFALGRRLAETNTTPVLLSWSGSMFEYLMPNLVMPVYENTLLDETSKGCVKKQIEYGKQHGVPWGISESGYNVVDANLTYQYRAFGVPDLGFKRGLGLDLVIAPYATIMSLMIDPAAACKNLKRLESKGYEGKYGFFEAIDYSPSRLTRSRVPALIQSFMVHHQGMSLLALDHLIYHQPMQRRFEADTAFQTALLLLQERVPKSIGFYSLPKDSDEIVHSSATGEMRVIKSPVSSHPEVQLLSNGKYHVMVSNSGGGYSRFKDMAVTRWREDSTRDNWGSFSYIRDLEDGEFWSNTYQPTLKEATSYEAIFSQGRAEFRRLDNGIELHTEIVVSPEDNVEIRRIHITNHTRSARKIEITSYGEVVIALPVADDAHPAFSNLFVQTEIIANQNAIICTRRPRSEEETPPWVFHLMKASDAKTDLVSYETDRYKFIGRGKSIASPQVMNQTAPLSNTQGPVLDPIVSIQYRITIDAEQTAIIDSVTGISETRSGCQTLVDKYQDRNFRNRGFELTWTHSQVVLRQINATEADAQLFSRLASSILYTNPNLRASKEVLIKNSRGQSALWSHSISGDLPIVLLLVSDSTNITLIRQLMQARSYWIYKGLVMDLVIINEDHSGYRQVLQEQVQSLITAGMGVNPTGRQGNIIVRLSDQISTEDKVLLQTVARVIISDKNGTLLDHVNKRLVATPVIPHLVQTKTFDIAKEKLVPLDDRLFDNGLGGFNQSGDEYIIATSVKRTTPLPWSNIIANPNFGTIVTESGPVYTWSENAHEFRLTPWNNDPVSNNGGEAFYLRDEESGYFWSPMPFPAKGQSIYVTKHGFGYSVFETNVDGIITETWIYVDIEAQIKFTVIKVRNQSGRARSLSATGYVEWVLGSLRPGSQMHVVTEIDSETGSLLSRNPYNTEFANRTAFFDVNSTKFSFTTDRHEFLGRNGTLEEPEGMKRLRLSGSQGAGFDPCSAIQVPFFLSNGQEKELIFRMGAAKDSHELRKMMARFSGREAAVNSLATVRTFWSNTLSQTKVKTPEPSVNILANGWLQYQVISCRLWGRSGFYQSGGAFGFRDQLQDVMALLDSAPQLAREQILLSASRQFKEGDVQHWWHPPQGRGVRTRCSDDFLWLAFATSRYVFHTHDFDILNEPVSFLEGRELNADQESNYDLPITTDLRTTLYDHCKRAIQHAINFGSHGLPFMGSGDWNDGMNNVGIKGQGESVWLAFFLFDVLRRFEPVAKKMNDAEFVSICEDTSAQLKVSLDNAWDGEWYRRAYFDDGTPLGSADNTECRIDSISQSWAVLSEAGTPERIFQAMESVDKYLVDKTNSLLRLLDPPFDHSEKDPGYIKGYLPGVRENGGQYSHAAIWMVMAVAKMGNRQRTWDLLQMVNPINHGRTADEISVYKTEPYVMAADVYGVHPHIGRGGWTWYTGSAGWMYQLITESFLGLKREGSVLHVNPCVPEHWKSFEIEYRYKTSTYHIEIVLGSEKDQSVKVDGVLQPGRIIQLADDGKVHRVSARLSGVTHVVRSAVEYQE